MKILQFPLSKITLWFVLGILLSFYIKPEPSLTFLLLFISFAGFVIGYLLSNRNFEQHVFFGLLVYLSSFFIGVTTQVLHTDYFDKDNYIHQVGVADKEHLLEVVLREKLKASVSCDRYVAVVKHIDKKECSGKILVNIYRNKLAETLIIGSNLQIKAVVLKHKPVNNPEQFDDGHYLTNKSILAQLYVSAYEVRVGSKVNTDLWYYSDRLRRKILDNLRKGGFGNDELNVAAALILGQQQDIAPDILHDYQYAGAIHVLSVSGLHVGYLLLFINFLLKPLPRNRFSSYLKLAVLLLSLWGFALLAGFSPSVVRSVTMFSFVAVGMHLNRSTYVFHTLLLSAFFILLFRPAFLFDVGFQLSYAALFFILWLQPLLSGIWSPTNKIKKYFWDIITVSVAAQIGALPLSVYYFHQFPGLFFLTNLIILPGLGIIMALGVLVMVLAAFDCVFVFSSKALEWSIYILDQLIKWVASFEHFIIKDIPLNWQMLVSLYLLIFAVIIWFVKPNFVKAIAFLMSLLLIQIVWFNNSWNQQHERELIVFDIKKKTIVAERVGARLSLYSNDSIQKNQTIQSYAVANFIGIVNHQPLHNLLYFNNNKIMVIDSSAVYSKKSKPDILLLTKSPKLNLARLFQTIKPKIIIADGSNYKTYIKAWKATCLKEKIPFHATGEKGFYKVK